MIGFSEGKRDRQRVNASEEGRRKVGEPVFLGEMLSEKEQAAPRRSGKYVDSTAELVFLSNS